MQKVYLIISTFFLTSVSIAQTTYFEQNFSAGGTTASYVNATSPNNGQFNGLSGLSATVTNNAVQFSRPTDSGTGYMSRSTNFAGPPTSLHVQFSFEVISHDPTVTGTSAVMFYVGSGFNAGPTNPSNAETYARLGIALAASPATSGQFQVRTVPSGGGGTVSATFSGRQTITFAMNNSGAELNYVSPTGATETLPNDTYDIWVGTMKFADNQAVLSPGQSISNFKFRINDGVGVMQIGNLLMRDISGVLPVTLLSFSAKSDGDRVQLSWATSMERNAERFVVERSVDLSEYVAVGDVAAKGTTDERQYYGLTDLSPQTGINYYRLKQIDTDGTVYLYKPISVIVRADESVVTVAPNPANPDQIRLRLWNVPNATAYLVTTTGQRIDGQLESQNNEAVFMPNQPLPAGLYWLNVVTNGQRKTINVLVR